jgi:magnesium transporter
MAHRLTRARRQAVWIDLTAPDGARLKRALERAGWRERQGSSSSHRLRLYHWPHGIPDPEPIDLAIGPRAVVAWHSRPVGAWEHVPRPEPGSTVEVLCRYLDELLAEQQRRMDQCNDRIAELEQRALARPAKSVERETFRLKREILRMRQVIAAERDSVHHALRRGLPKSPEDTLRLVESYDQLVRLYEAVDMYREILNSVLDSYFSALSARLNEIVKTLTLVTTVMLPSSLIAALYGMNFRYLPWADSPWGFWGILGVMAAIGFTLLLWFRARGWF